jgi:hypothetical protein
MPGTTAENFQVIQLHKARTVRALAIDGGGSPEVIVMGFSEIDTTSISGIRTGHHHCQSLRRAAHVRSVRKQATKHIWRSRYSTAAWTAKQQRAGDAAT